MKTRLFISLLILPMIFQRCDVPKQEVEEPKTVAKEIHVREFDWTITIPENFVHINSKQWKAQQQRGKKLIENTLEEEVVNNSKTLFVFKSNEMNYLEASYQSFDPAINGDYKETFDGVNEILYETFKSQISGSKLDTSTTTELISGLTFQVFKLKITYPNKMVYYVEMYDRLFDKQEFTLNIMYTDKAKGDLMKEAWKNSTFGKSTAR